MGNVTDVALVGFDLDILDLIETHPAFNLIGFIDMKQLAYKADRYGIPYLGNDDNWDQIKEKHPHLKVAFGMNEPAIRKKVYLRYKSRHATTIISNMAYVSRRSKVGNGCVVQYGSKVMPAVVIGRGCSLNVNTTVHHESVVGDFSILAPGALVLGRVHIGEQVYVGAGAIIRENCKIGHHAVIGAGAVVLKDVEPDSIVVGVPANRKLNPR